MVTVEFIMLVVLVMVVVWLNVFIMVVAVCDDDCTVDDGGLVVW